MKRLGFLLALIPLLIVSIARAQSGIATAVRSIGISSEKLPCEKIEEELNAKSYFQAICLKRKISAEKPLKYYKLVHKKFKVDSVLVVNASTDQMELISTETGKVIASFSMNGSASAENLSMTVMEAFPYRGYLTEVRGDQVDLNLGSRHGIKPGVYLTIFEFTDDTKGVQSAHKVVGIVQVNTVSERASIGQIVDRKGRIARYNKIALEDAVPPKQSAITNAPVTAKKTTLTLGTEFREIHTTAKDPTGANRNYTMNSTPFAQLGVSRGKWNADFLYGYASDTAGSLSYMTIQGAYLIRSTGTFTSGSTISAGLWVSQFNATNKSSTVGPQLEDFTRYAPYAEYKYQRVVKDKLVLALAGELAYPVLSSSQEFVGMLQSFSLAVVPSARLRVADFILVEGGFRFQQINVKLKSSTSTSETHSGPFLHAIFLL